MVQKNLIEIVLPTCRLQYIAGGICIAGVYIADCRAGYIITYIVIILGNMQAAALQRQLVLKSYNCQHAGRSVLQAIAQISWIAC